MRMSLLLVLILQAIWSLEKFQEVVKRFAKTKGQDIFRMKGVLSFADSGNRYVFQGVHMLFDGQEDRPWKEGERINSLIFIGRNLDRKTLNERFSTVLNVDPSKLKLQDAMQLQNEFVLNDYIIDLAWSPCSKQITAVTVEGYVFLVDIEKRLKSCEPIGNHKIGCNSVSWNPHASQFATAGQDSKVSIWDSSSKAKFLELDAGGDWVSNVAYNPLAKQLASGAVPAESNLE